MAMCFSQLLVLDEVANACLAFADAFAQGRFQVGSRACRKIKHQSITDLYLNEQMVRKIYRSRRVQQFSLWAARSVTLYDIPLNVALLFMQVFHNWSMKQDDSRPIRLCLKVDCQTLKAPTQSQEASIQSQEAGLREVFGLFLQFMLSKKHMVICSAEASGGTQNKKLQYLSVTKRLLEANETNALWDVVAACRLPENAAWQERSALFEFQHDGNYLRPMDTPGSFMAYFVQQHIILKKMKIFKSPHTAMGLIDHCFAGLCLHKYCGAVVMLHKILAWSASYIELMAWADQMVDEYEREQAAAEQKKQQQEMPADQLAVRKPANKKKDNERAKKAALARICGGEELISQGTWIRLKPYSKTAAALPGFQRNPFCFGLMCFVDEVRAGDGARAPVRYRVHFHGVLKDETSDTDMATSTKRHSIITSWSDDIHFCIKSFWKPEEAHHLSTKSKYDQELSESKENAEAWSQRMVLVDAGVGCGLKTGDQVQFVSYNSAKHDHLPAHLKCLFAKRAMIRAIMSKGDAHVCRLLIEDDHHNDTVLSVAAEEVLAILR